jgi:GNAT superfamily N-acetyltransferase
VIGVAELRATREAPHEREIAFSVDPERRDRGWATRLVAASIATARGCRFGRLHALCSPANQGMLDILARAGFTVERRGVDVVTYLVLAPPPAKTADSTDSAPRRDKGLDPPRTGSAASDERMAGLQERDGHCRGR